jgi:voltage-gated potassium channel
MKAPAPDPASAGQANFFERAFLPAREAGWRHRLYLVIFHHEKPAERNFDLLLILTILVCVVVVMIDSVPAIKLGWHDALSVAEWVFALLFSVEYTLMVSVRRPWRYAASFFGVIDLLAILPTMIRTHCIAGTAENVGRIAKEKVDPCALKTRP